MIEKFEGQNGYAIVPTAAITDRRLSASSVQVLSFLLSKTANWRVIAAQVGSALGMSERTARRALENLEDCGYARPVFANSGEHRHRTDTIIYATPIRTEMTGSPGAPADLTGSDQAKMTGSTPVRSEMSGSPQSTRSKMAGSTKAPAHPVKNDRIHHETTPKNEPIRSKMPPDPDIFVQASGQICPDRSGQKCPPTQEETQEELLKKNYSESDGPSAEELRDIALMEQDTAEGAAAYSRQVIRIQQRAASGLVQKKSCTLIGPGHPLFRSTSQRAAA